MRKLYITMIDDTEEILFAGYEVASMSKRLSKGITSWDIEPISKQN